MSGIKRQHWQRASHHLDHLLDLPPGERRAFLVRLQREEPETAVLLEGLLAEHRLVMAEQFLDTPAPIAAPQPPLAGVMIGAYTLVAPIGQGGMGSVWLAARSDGRFEGQAALKLLNTELLGHAGEERFKREGTILARLTHPHIARLIDAGVTGAGQPYLVLEHIDGRYIDRFCDEQRLGIKARLRLFLDVQSAVAHAHAHLIVHRDLKPSNVLVNVEGQVKLLDFGIAKLLEPDTQETALGLLTAPDSQALTPKYAAPEQVVGGRITTATDVYTLGVLLFELLSGQHPTGEHARSSGEFVKAVIDTEPARLSASINEEIDPVVAATRSAQRSTTPERLRRALRGDLDTILAKALKKNPDERYGSVAEFADDLRRHLDDLPIAAKPDALGYRASKFVRRHRRILWPAAVAATFIIGLMWFYTVQLRVERDRARLQAEKASKSSELLTGVLTSADPYRTPDGKEPTVQNLLDASAERVISGLSEQPDLQAQMLTVIGRTYERMGLQIKALPLLERALEIGRRGRDTTPVQLAQSLNDLGVLYRELGDLTRAEPLLQESLMLRRQWLGAEDKDVAVTLVELARVLQDRGRSAEAEPHAREALAIRRTLFGDDHRETATSKNELGLLLLRRGDVADAEPLLRDNVATNVRLLGADHPNTAAARSSLALLLIAKGEASSAETLLRESLGTMARVFGVTHPRYARTLSNMASALEEQGQFDQAQALLEEGLRIVEPMFGDDHPDVVTYAVNLARLRLESGAGAATEVSLRHALAVRERVYQAGDWRIAQVQGLLGGALLAANRDAEAEAEMLAAARVLKPVPGPQQREYLANRARLERLRLKSGGLTPLAAEH